MIPPPGSALRTLVFFLLMASSRLPAAGPESVSDPVKIWITFKDKGASSGPAAAVNDASPAALAYQDLPVYAPYLQALQARGVRLSASLKWQNRISAYAAEAALPALSALPFVAAVSRIPRKAKAVAPRPGSPLAWPYPFAKRAAAGLDYGASRTLMKSLHVDKLHDYLFAIGKPPGQGVRIAVIDDGFHLGSPIFTAMKGRIRDQHDFADTARAAVSDSLLGSHGAQCMSLIGGNLPGTLVGAAPEADFLLYRTELAKPELYEEEDYLAAAIERAVDSGAQVISISLGYRYDYTDGTPDRPFSEFDGRTRPSSLAALGAARRNVLVSVSMGNEGDTEPAPALGAPADADSILAVGIQDRFGRRCAFSSGGPTADGRIKPDIMTIGDLDPCRVAVANTSSATPKLNSFSGTSFAAPVMAGIAALLRQMRPDFNAQKIRHALISTADRYTHPDSGSGYGLADAAEAARRLGIPIDPPLVRNGQVPVYHADDGSPILLAWDPDRPIPALQLFDLTGRRFPVSVSAAGSLLTLDPARRLRSGIYIAKIP
jgi:subtilisin family serine protease